MSLDGSPPLSYHPRHGHPYPAERHLTDALPGRGPAQPQPLARHGGDDGALQELLSPHQGDVDTVGGTAGQEGDQAAHQRWQRAH